MQAGNSKYISATDLPDHIAIFPLPSVLILPGGYLSLNVFESRYLELVEDAIAGNRLIGIIQLLPEQRNKSLPDLYLMGCIARIVSFSETGDGSLAISLQGICRFKRIEEITTTKPYRLLKIAPQLNDLNDSRDQDNSYRETLLNAFSDYLEAHELEADWESIVQASSETLVNALSISAPFGTAEKQALLEAPNIKARAEILIALAERSILAQDGIKPIDLQ